MLDPPLKFAQQQIDENKALTDLLAAWGVTVDKDLVLDTSGVGQLFGLGPEIPLVTTYDSHAIVRPMKDVPSGFPIARSLEVKNGDKTTVEKLFETSDNSFATTNLKSADIRPSPTDKKGPLTLGAAGTYNGGGQRRRTLRGGRLFALGRQFVPALQRKSRPVPEHDELAVVGRGPDLDPAQGAGRPPP